MDKNYILTTGKKEFNKNLFNPVGKTDWRNKPETGGFWGSTLTSKDDNYSSWVDFVLREQFHVEDHIFGIMYQLNNDIKITEVNDIYDYRKLISKFPFYDYISDRVQLDFQKMSQKYDCFHISENAVCELRMFLYCRDEEFFHEKKISDFYNWDVESYLILSPS